MDFQKKTAYLVISVVILLLAACAPEGPSVPVTGNTSIPNTPAASPEIPPQVVVDAQQWLATQLGIEVEQVQIVEVQPVEWTDSCLGLGQPNESCLQATTPGWQVIFDVNGKRYEVRANETGSTIRLATP
ncbi:MAG: hypothetical protein ACM33V_07595 [Chloroflexota bacterium]|nr:hypothetical protein [Anaerolineales bacterium]